LLSQKAEQFPLNLEEEKKENRILPEIKKEPPKNVSEFRAKRFKSPAELRKNQEPVIQA